MMNFVNNLIINNDYSNICKDISYFMNFLREKFLLENERKFHDGVLGKVPHIHVAHMGDNNKMDINLVEEDYCEHEMT